MFNNEKKLRNIKILEEFGIDHQKLLKNNLIHHMLGYDRLSPAAKMDINSSFLPKEHYINYKNSKGISPQSDWTEPE